MKHHHKNILQNVAAHSGCPHSADECPHCGGSQGASHGSGCPHSADECPHCGASHDPSGTCNYTASVHQTAEAHAYHQDKCVTRIMATMGNATECLAYMSGVSEGNPAMAGCSIRELTDICAHKATEFTQQDAEQLCMAMNTASGKFWQSYQARH